MATGATGGFLYVPGMTGAPASATGPTGYTGTVAHVFDVSNNMPWYLNPVNTFAGSTGATPSWVAGNGQVLIQRILLGGATGTVTFSNIPQVFNHLRVMIIARESAATSIDNVTLQLNGDTGANYDFERIELANTAIAGTQSVGQTNALCGLLYGTSTPSYIGSNVIDFPYYTNTTFFKNANCTLGITSSNAGVNYARLLNLSWRNTSAISSMSFTPGNGNFVTASAFYLYGIW